MTKGIIHSDEYSAAEKEKLIEFRQKVSDILLTEDQQDDSFLIRWLRARNLNITKAEEMLRHSMQWRKDNNIDTILERETVPEDVTAKTPVAFCGITPDGYGLFVCPFGKHDTRSALEKYGVEACSRFNIINMEKLTKMMKDEGLKHGRKVTQILEILDCEGYSYRQMSSKLCREFMVQTQHHMDANYPELLRYAMIINCPKIFAILFALLKPIIPKNTLEKLDIFGPDQTKWKKVVAEKFPLDMIPPKWGGTLKGVDEYCSGHKMWLQGPSDLRSFLSGISEEDADFEIATINAREKFIKEFDIEESSSILEWKFKTEGNDVGFQISYSKSAGAGSDCQKEIVPFSRVDSHIAVQEGSHVCDVPGIYCFTFDNSFSYLKSKTLLYQVTVISPQQDLQKCPEY